LLWHKLQLALRVPDDLAGAEHVRVGDVDLLVVVGALRVHAAPVAVVADVGRRRGEREIVAVGVAAICLCHSVGQALHLNIRFGHPLVADVVRGVVVCTREIDLTEDVGSGWNLLNAGLRLLLCNVAA